MKRVACIGDSITWGFTLLRPWKQSYPALLQEKFGPDYKVRNFGYNDAAARFDADTPYVKKKVYQESIDWNPDIVFIMLGTNDTKKRNWDPNIFRRDYTELVKSYMALPSHPRVILLAPIRIFLPFRLPVQGLYPETMEQGVRPAIREVAQKLGLDLIDLVDLFQDTTYVKDGVHPQAAGAAMIAETVYNAFISLNSITKHSMIQQSAMRADFVGSFLRPEAVKKARLQFAAGEITRDQLTAVEDEAIRNLVKKQMGLGFKVITDGEFRRQAWHLDFMWGFNGIGHAPTKTGLPFHGEQAMIDETFLTGTVSLGDHHPFVDHFRFVASLAKEGVEAKLTIPAPAQFLAQMVMPFALENTRKYYADNEEIIQDIAAAYRKFIQLVYAAGCRRLQFDDCTWGMLVDPAAIHMWGTDEEGLKKVQEMNLRINNMAIEGKPADMFINTHVCRGNYHSTYANSGAYDKVAEVLFERENVNAYFLEFDDSRSGGFEPLAHVSGDKMVVLGLVTTKSPKLEFKSLVKERIMKAAEYIPLDRLCLSPQCGFASCEIGNKLTEEEQWAKLRLVQEVAKEVWGD